MFIFCRNPVQGQRDVTIDPKGDWYETLDDPPALLWNDPWDDWVDLDEDDFNDINELISNQGDPSTALGLTLSYLLDIL